MPAKTVLRARMVAIQAKVEIISVNLEMLVQERIVGQTIIVPEKKKSLRKK